MKNRKKRGDNRKGANGLKQYNLNKATSQQKMLEERQTWLRRRNISREQYRKTNKTGAGYMKLFEGLFIQPQSIGHGKVRMETIKNTKLYRHPIEEKKTNSICRIRNEMNFNREKEIITNYEKPIMNIANDTRIYHIQHIPKKESSKNLNLVKIHKGSACDYKFGEQIGKGAYAIVKEGIHISTETPVAIKIYDKLRFSEQRRKKRLELEISILKQLNHVNIVKYFDFFQTPNHLYLVMELIKGKSLRDYMKLRKDKRLTERRSLKILKELALALYYCHSNGIAHRDIKLDNILLDALGNVKLIDFGFSSINVNTQKLTTHCGTLSYMSPEIVSKKDYYGGPADMWALGVVFHAMLFGKYPFNGKTDPELISKIKQGSFDIGDEISDKSKKIIKRLLEIDPEKRLSAQTLVNYLS